MKRKHNGWNSGTQHPSKPGIYQRSYTGKDKLFSYWNGHEWGKTYANPDACRVMEFEASSSQLMPWRPVP